MGDQNLRAALENLCDTMEPMDDRCSAAYLRELLAAHPAEPVVVEPCRITADGWCATHSIDGPVYHDADAR